MFKAQNTKECAKNMADAGPILRNEAVTGRETHRDTQNDAELDRQFWEGARNSHFVANARFYVLKQAVVLKTHTGNTTQSTAAEKEDD